MNIAVTNGSPTVNKVCAKYFDYKNTDRKRGQKEIIKKRKNKKRERGRGK
jgi:hypothetical protein